MGGDEMQQMGHLINRVLDAPEDADVLAAVKVDVESLAKRFPLYASRLQEIEDLA